MEILTKVRRTSLSGAGIAIVVCFSAFFSFGQETKKVEGIKGQWIISDDITPIQARAKALEEAKAEALRNAGVAEHVAESNVLYKTEKDSEVKDIHKSLTSTDISGEICEFQVIAEEKKINEFGNLMYEVWINATVILHKTSKDPGFNVEVIGLRDKYRSPEELVFEIKPSREGFLNIFIIGDDESLLLFPNKFEKQERFEGGKVYGFPRSRALDYEVSSDENTEVNYLILLYTKTEIPFREAETSENILQFIARIDPAQKCIRSYPILIRQQ